MLKSLWVYRFIKLTFGFNLKISTLGEQRNESASMCQNLGND